MKEHALDQEKPCPFGCGSTFKDGELCAHFDDKEQPCRNLKLGCTHCEQDVSIDQASLHPCFIETLKRHINSDELSLKDFKIVPKDKFRRIMKRNEDNDADLDNLKVETLIYNDLKWILASNLENFTNK